MLREVALEYLHFRHSISVDDVPHLLTFMRNHPRLEFGKTVTSLHLRHSTIEAKVVDDMASLLPNLSSLTLESVRALRLGRGDVGDSNAAPLRLSRLDIHLCPRSYVSGLMHLLSSFNPKNLHLSGVGEDVEVEVFDARRLARLSDVESINVHPRTGGRKSIAPIVDALSKTLAADSLKSIRVTYDSKDTVRAYGRMIERLGSKITSLTLFARPPYPFEKRVGWVDPFDEWRLLNVHACKELQILEIPIYVPQGKPDRAVSHVGAGILAHHAPPSLRKVVIMLHDLPRPTTLGNRIVLKLQEFDKVVTQARFPHLQEFELGIAVTYDLTRKRGYWEKCVAAARRALPGLHARGLLKITNQRYTW
ncbi:hypothetical protein C8T65DRAFT_632429 [Cerioporus squamosus]|nr:hypothetical protein C8T65DRAFT_632429 [Cerioporus squamosus]